MNDIPDSSGRLPSHEESAPDRILHDPLKEGSPAIAPVPPTVILWPARARNDLGPSVTEQLCKQPPHLVPDYQKALEATMTSIDNLLSRTFPGSRLVVQSLMFGFRRKDNQHILRVDVCDGPKQGTYVVKVGPEVDLRVELDGWRQCKPAGLRNDVVLLSLEPGCDPREGDEARMMAIYYGDAQQALGITEVVNLEEAVLQCIEHNLPSLTSVRNVLDSLMERLAHIFYRAAVEVDPARQPFVALPLGKLPEALNDWHKLPSPPQKARTQVNALLPERGARRFVCPVSYLRYIQKAALPLPQGLLPPFLRGPAHGDLHGRNILVGIIHARAQWPMVFDYEHMGPLNPVCWDFAKLEHELKTRAYEQLFSRKMKSYIHDIQQFEMSLARDTETFTLNRSWPTTSPEATPLERLRAVLLEIRSLAYMLLGDERGRPGWLDEYNFMLAAYSVATGRFENLHERELIAGYVSGGVACAQLSWVRDHEHRQRRRLGLDPFPALEQPLTGEQVLTPAPCGHELPLAVARGWVRSGNSQLQQQAVALLTWLKANFSWVLEVHQELSLALTETNRTTEAAQALNEAADLAPEGDEEFLCRWGRLHKDQGDAALKRNDLAQADTLYRQAEQKYRQAYEIRRGHYPGDNLATILLLRSGIARKRGDEGAAGALKSAGDRIVDELLKSRANWPRENPDDDIWHLATAGAICMLKGQWEQARSFYAQALACDGVKQFHRDSMSKQAERIKGFYRDHMGITDFGPMDDRDLFPR